MVGKGVGRYVILLFNSACLKSGSVVHTNCGWLTDIYNSCARVEKNNQEGCVY